MQAWLSDEGLGSHTLGGVVAAAAAQHTQTGLLSVAITVNISLPKGSEPRAHGQWQGGARQWPKATARFCFSPPGPPVSSFVTVERIDRGCGVYFAVCILAPKAAAVKKRAQTLCTSQWPYKRRRAPRRLENKTPNLCRPLHRVPPPLPAQI